MRSGPVKCSEVAIFLWQTRAARGRGTRLINERRVLIPVDNAEDKPEDNPGEIPKDVTVHTVAQAEEDDVSASASASGSGETRGTSHGLKGLASTLAEADRSEALVPDVGHESMYMPEGKGASSGPASPLLRTAGRVTRGVGRRIFLGIVGFGAVVTLVGGRLSRVADDTVLGRILPVTGRFRIYSVTSEMPRRKLEDWSLTIEGDVENPQRFTYADLEALGFETDEQDFHCVTGWSVYNVRWTGIPLGRLLDLAGVKEDRNVRFFSFDGVYTESLSVREARLPGNMVAVALNDSPLSLQQGFPARVIIPSMYGYKGTKWVDRILVEEDLVAGYWVLRGYDQDGTVGASNGFGS